jgi:zinc and cadmium transporter
MNDSPYFYMLILFLAAMLGGGIFFLTKKQSTNSIKLLLSFSAAYLLGLTLLHLFPELFESGIEYAGWYVMAGFLLQVILDFFSHGVEHGHAHSHAQAGTRFLFTVMASLWVHAFIEGMPFGGEMAGHVHDHSHHGHSHGPVGDDHRGSLLIGISLHKITESLVFAALLINSGVKTSRALFWVIVFAMVAPAGAFVHHYLIDLNIEGVATLTPKVTGVLIGILLHVSTTIIFESEEGHKFNWMKFGSILVGIALAALVS